jgi:hypothetical protein
MMSSPERSSFGIVHASLFSSAVKMTTLLSRFPLLDLVRAAVFLLDYPFKAQWLLYVPSAVTLKTAHFAHRIYLCVAYEPHSKQRLFT